MRPSVGHMFAVFAVVAAAWIRLSTAATAAGTASDMPMLALGAGDTHCSPDCAGAVEEALRLGFRHVDTAYEYGTQVAVGKGLKAAGLPREDVWLTTKIPGPVGHSQAKALLAQGLQELGTEYVDLLLMHYPCLEGWPDPRDACSAEDGAAERLATWHAMEELQREGKARHIGVSNFHLRHLERLLDGSGNASVPFSNQVEWHLGWHDEKLLEYCRQHGIQLQAYSPLGGGGTTTGHNGGVALDDPAVVKVAKSHNKSEAQVALRWSLDKDVAVVTATTKPSHMKSDLEVLHFSLSPGEVAELDALDAVVPSVQILDDWPDVTMPIMALGTRPADLGNLSVGLAIQAWAKQGGRHIDVAVGAEAEARAGIASVIEEVAARDELFITAKVPGPMGAAAVQGLVLRQLLPALNLTYLDLLVMQLNATSGDDCDGLAGSKDRIETWQALEDLQRQGRVRSIGVADFRVCHLEQLLPHVRPTSGNTSFVAVNQVEWHLGWHDDALLTYCRKHGITLQAASPLGSPAGRHPAASLASPAVAAAARAHAAAPARVALRWALQRGVPLVAPAGAAGGARAELEALFGLELTRAEMSALDALGPAAPAVRGDISREMFV